MGISPEIYNQTRCEMMHRKTSQVWENYPGWCFGTIFFIFLHHIWDVILPID